jgi:hypothetical protein
MPLFIRLFVAFGIIAELLLLAYISKAVPADMRLIAFIVFSAPFLGTAFAIAAAITSVSYLGVVLVIRPRLANWRNPKIDESHSDFHLAPREVLRVESPGRMKMGKAWKPGRLLQTDRRILFIPNGWDVEPWEVKLDQVKGLDISYGPPMLWKLVHDLSPRLKIVTLEGLESLFIMPDAVGWYVDASR